MTTSKLHHVVFVVRAENQDQAADYWRSLGMTFAEVPLEEEGIRVLLDWSGGIEIVSPAAVAGTETARFEAFLAERGEGPYSVVVRTDDYDAAKSAVQGFGVAVRYEQHREHGEGEGAVVVDEADLEPVLGMGVTLLSTNLPD
jgi:catechol 2,3-dioxygenase-like lactoylglutathione lyase family enzyme